MKKIAVYGTLKTGWPTNALLRGSKKIKEGFFEIPYAMYDNKAYPFLVKTDDYNKIFLEIYKVDEETEKELDYYEGYPYLFSKEEVQIEQNLAVNIYVAGEQLAAEHPHHQKVKNGNYGNN